MEIRKILIVAAHDSEAEALRRVADACSCSPEILVTGVGGISMAWALQKRLAAGPVPDLAINAGIAGSYVTTLRIGDVVLTGSDCFADLGIDDNGIFRSLFSAGLAGPDTFPFSGGRIYCRNRWFDKLINLFPVVNAATVNMASGSEEPIQRIRSVWNPDIETMEGAYFAYVCSMAGLPWLGLKAVSNMTEPRNIKKWDINAALKGLGEGFAEVIKNLEE